MRISWAVHSSIDNCSSITPCCDSCRAPSLKALAQLAIREHHARSLRCSARTPPRAAAIPSRPRRAVAARARFETGDDVPGGTYETYEHDGWTCGYRHKTGCEPADRAPAPGRHRPESSWFWTRVMAELPNEVYAPDFYWVRPQRRVGPGRARFIFTVGLLAASRRIMAPEDRQALLRRRAGRPGAVGVYLASRSSDRWDGARAVAGLALSAPPPFADLAEGLDSAEVARNLGLPAVVARAAARQTAPERLLRQVLLEPVPLRRFVATRRGSAIAWWTMKDRNL